KHPARQARRARHSGDGAATRRRRITDRAVFLQAMPRRAGYPVRMSSNAHHLLEKIFGHREFRGEQGEIVRHVAEGNDALVLMPTGGVKSLCYQLPALLRDGVAIVVSPLIALMQDQVDALRQLGVRAAFLNSSLDAAAAQAVERQLLAAELDLLYV